MPSLQTSNETVSIAVGSGTPGCEETNECYIPFSLSILDLNPSATLRISSRQSK